MKVIFTDIVIACDHPDCRVKTKYHDVTVEEVEQMAAEDGWKNAGDRDYCRAHPKPEREM